MEKYCGEFDHKANVLLQVFKSSGMYFVNSLTLPVLIHVSYFFLHCYLPKDYGQGLKDNEFSIFCEFFVSIIRYLYKFASLFYDPV